MHKKLYAVLSIAVLASLLASNVAFAKEDRTAVSKIKLNIDYNLQNDDAEVSITSEGSNYTLDDYEVVNEPEDGWKSYDSPEVLISLSVDDNYYFSKQTSGYFEFDLDDTDDTVTFVSASRDDDKETMEVLVMLPPKNGKIGNAYNLTWNKYGVASWTKGYKATKYSVSLHKDNSRIKEVNTTSTSYNFADTIIEKGLGNYKFKVTAKNSSNTAQVIESYDFTVGANELALMQTAKNNGGGVGGPGGPGGGTTTPDMDIKPVDPTGKKPTDAQVNNYLNGPGSTGLAKGWIRDGGTGLWWYRNSDGGWTKNNWQYIDNAWYHFDQYGWMQTGWILDNNKWYLLAPSGEMKTGWNYINNKWYYMNASGAMQVGYVTVNGRQYYLENGSNPTKKVGETYINEKVPDGRFADGTGALS